MDIALFRDMIESVNSASVAGVVHDAANIIAGLQSSSQTNVVDCGLLMVRYNYIKESALVDSLISYTNGVASDVFVNGAWRNPYDSDILFAFTPGSNVRVVPGAVSFVFNHYVSNLSSPYELQFDADDGLGYRTITSSGTTASYSSDGQKHLKLKLIIGNDVYESHCRLTVHPYMQPAPTPPSIYDTLSVTGLYADAFYRAMVSYPNSTTFNKQPLIVSEGFDPWKLSPENDIHSFSGFGKISKLSQSNTSTRNYLFNHFDVYYVDWYDCGADIRANAEVLKEVIGWVNSHNTSGLPNIVLGQSMGGLIARYALRDMEIKGELHNTSLFISHDVPYLGANVSIGLQYMYWDLLEAVDNLGVGGLVSSLLGQDAYNTLRDIGSYTSVRQMLSLYVGSDHVMTSSVHDSFREKLLQMGFPRGSATCPIEIVAIVNGGRTRSGNASIYNQGDMLIKCCAQTTSNIIEAIAFFKDFRRNWSVAIPGKGHVTYNYEVYPYLTNNTTVHKAELKIQ